MGDHAFHVRRRLSAREQETVGEAVDIRRTGEARRRASMVGSRLGLAPPGLLADEIGQLAS